MIDSLLNTGVYVIIPNEWLGNVEHVSFYTIGKINELYEPITVSVKKKGGDI